MRKKKKEKEEGKEGLKKEKWHSSSRYTQSNLSHKEREGWESSFPHCTKRHLCMELRQRKRKGLKFDEVPPARTHTARKVPLWASLRECLGLVKGHRGPRLGHSRCFLRSQEQQGSQGCRRCLIFFSWEMGFT